MKFIMLYGPPASGKLTVAKELQKISGFRLFHNHMLVDLLESIDGERTEDFFKTHDVIFEEAIKYAVKRDVNLINTFVYGKGVDDKFMRFTRETVEKSGGEAIYVQVIADKKALLSRVEEESRKKFTKITDSKKLEALMEKYDMFTPYKDTDLLIDNTDRSPKDVAKEIWEFVNK